MMSLVSVIIVNYNGEKFLQKCLDSIFASKYKNFEVILIDNNSEDNGLSLVKRRYSKVKVIENKENLGFCLANNKAAKLAQGKYLFFLNNDTVIAENTLGELVKTAEDDAKVGICGCQMRSYSGKECFHNGIGIDIFGYPIVKDKIFYIEGSALLVRKDLFCRLNGFDSEYFMFHEDIDLAWRTWLLGYLVTCAPAAIVYHVAGASAGGMPTKGKYKSSYLRRYYSERNNLRTLLKNYSSFNLGWILPLYFLINLAEFGVYFISLNFRMMYLYLKGYLWNAANLRDTLKERKRVQRQRKVTDKQIVKRMFLGSGKFYAFTKVGIPTFQ